MYRMRGYSVVLILAIAIAMSCGSAVAQPRVPQMQMVAGGAGSVLLDMMVLLRLAPLQLSVAQIDAILQVCEDRQPQTASETMQQLEELRERLLRGEQPTAADLQLLGQAFRNLRGPAGDDPQAEQTIQIIEALLTPEQLAMLAQGFMGRGRRQADSGAAFAVFAALTRIMNEADADKQRQETEALLKAIGEAAGGQMDEAAIQDLQNFFDRVLAMGEAEFTESRQELLTELEVLVPPEVDVGKLYLAMDPERVQQQIRFLFMTEQAQQLLREMRDARAEEE